MSKMTLAIIALGMVITFQNCSNGANFESAGQLVEKADASPSADDGSTPNNGSSDVVDGTTPPSTDDGEDCDHDGQHGGQHGHVRNPSSADSLKSGLLYVCVLEGSGKSVKVGVAKRGLGGQTGTPNDVCMTQNACLNILSKKFDVKGAEKRGFCPNKNPNVVPMTDSEIEASLAESELLKLNRPTL